MATRSNIAMKLEDGNILCVYCHWDGYPEHHFPILIEHYNTEEKVRELLSHGDISSLRKYCTKPEGHSFETPVEDYTIYYGRDRGETNVSSDVINKSSRWYREEFGYLFVDGKWEIYDKNDIIKQYDDAVKRFGIETPIDYART